MSGKFTRNQLKAAAMIAMFCDHFAVVFLQGEPYLVMRMIGRIAFPIFAYFIVQGFLHTSDFRKYFMRIGIFALISEIPFDLVFSGKVLELHSQNVMFTMLIGLGMLFFLRKWGENGWARGLVFLAGCLCGAVLRVDYSWFGVAVVGLFYLLRNSWERYRLFVFSLLFFSYGGIEWFGILGVLGIMLYREEREVLPLPKYLFYIFYPAHLLFLFFLNMI
jgi:TraX protein.